MSLGKDDYFPYLQNPTFRSPRNDVVYPYFYPLTARSLDDRLNFQMLPRNGLGQYPVIPQVGNVQSDSGDFKSLTPSHFIRFTNDLASPNSQLRMSSAATVGSSDPSKMNYFYMDNENPSSTKGWVVKAEPDGPTGGGIWDQLRDGVANPGTAGQNLVIAMMNGGWNNNPPKTMCFLPGDVQDPLDANIRFYPPEHGTNPACKWRTNLEAFGCCTATPGQTKDPNIVQRCAPAFMPNGFQGSICVPFMQEVCENNWDEKSCSAYLQSFLDNADVGTVVQNIVRNNINNRAEKAGCGTNDYTSPLVQGSKACRDDSKDPFISKTLLTLCGAISSSHNGNCDQLLDQYCAEFTRDDLLKDPTLQTICGCHLSTSSTPPSNVGLKLAGKNQDNQYKYPGMTPACDPICAFSGTLQTNATPCDQTVCIMDNISVSEMSSTNCDTTINQICGQDKKGGAIGNCYISNVDISAINSDCGGIFLHQNCQNCFSFEPGTEWNGSIPASAKKIQCSNPTGNGGDPSSPGNGPGGTKLGFFGWLKAHPFYVAGFFIILAFLIFFVTFFIYERESVSDSS